MSGMTLTTTADAMRAVGSPRPYLIRSRNKNRILVHGMRVPGDQVLLIRRRLFRKATGQARKKAPVIVRAEGLLPSLEETEVFGILCALLLCDPRENLIAHMERPSTYAVWLHVVHGGHLSSDEPVVAEVVKRSRALLEGVWVTTEAGSQQAWSPAMAEEFIQDRLRVGGADSLVKYARECLAVDQERNIALGPCECGRRKYTADEAIKVLVRAQSGQWRGDQRPTHIYLCPSSRCFHITAK